MKAKKEVLEDILPKLKYKYTQIKHRTQNAFESV